MKKFCLSIIVLLSALMAVDRAVGGAMQWVGQHSQDVLAPKLCYVSRGVHEDVVLIGASRCHHHYVPSILSDSLELSVYNAGVGGSNNIFSHFFMLCQILRQHTPQMVCLEVMPTDFNRQDAPFSALGFFAPLMGGSTAADSLFRLAGTYRPYRLSMLYRYNRKASSNLWGLVMNRQKDADHGYIPLPNSGAFPKKLETEEPSVQTDPLKMYYLRRFISLCQQRNIMLVFMVSPKFTQVSPAHYKVLKVLARQYNIPFLDYHTPGVFHDHPEYFKDASHLCADGARRFSAIVAGDLKAGLMGSAGATIHR